MTIAVTLITTENSKHSFTLDTSGDSDAFLGRLKNNAQFVFGKPFIVASSVCTEVFAPGSIARIEIAGPVDLDALLPDAQISNVVALRDDAPDPGLEGTYGESQFKIGMTLYFRGGDTLRLCVEGKRKSTLPERLTSLTGIFARPVVFHCLARGGIGLINPQAVTRTRITPAVPDLPRDAWLVGPD